MGLVRAAERLARGWNNYGNPLGLAWQRALKKPVLEVRDRATGLRFQCRAGADRMFGEVFHLNVYDIPTAPLRAGDVVLDIGANHGFYAVYAAAVFGATVYAFEPDPKTLDLLSENVRRNGVSGKVHVRPWAIGAASGEIDLFLTDQLGGGMSSTVPGLNKSPNSVRVRCVTFADALVECGVTGSIRTVKMDCEGAEFDIVKSLTPELRRRIESLALEFHPGAYVIADLTDELSGWGDYHVSSISTGAIGNATLHVTRDDTLHQWAASIKA